MNYFGSAQTPGVCVCNMLFPSDLLDVLQYQNITFGYLAVFGCVLSGDVSTAHYHIGWGHDKKRDKQT
jgi:hypothetical protein